MKLNTFSLENFGVFNKEVKIDFAPITIFTGQNNSGKSTVFKLLKLMNNSFRDDLSQDLDFACPDVNIGGFKRAINHGTKNNHIKLKIENWVFSYVEHPQSDLFARLDNLTYISTSEKKLFEFDSFLIPGFMMGGAYDLIINIDNIFDEFSLLNSNELTKKDIQDFKQLSKIYNLKISSYSTQIFKGQGLYPQYPGNAIEEIYNNLLKSDSSEIDSIRNYLLQIKGISLLNEEEFDFIHHVLYIIKQWVFKVSYDLFKFTKSFPYQHIFLDAFRGESFHNINSSESKHPLAVFSRIYLKNFSKEKTSYNGKSQENYLTEDVHKYLSYWVKRFEIGNSAKIVFDKNNASLNLKIYRNKYVETLPELGFGSSQLIPIIILTSLFPLNKPCLIIEEPESHLHPKLQSQLADLFLEYKDNNGSVIIETHSEYLIRKLQFLTAKKKLKPEDTVIYYFNDPDKIPKGEKQVREIRIREDGMMDDDFGEGFFDESTRLTIDLLKLQNKN